MQSSDIFTRSKTASASVAGIALLLLLTGTGLGQFASIPQAQAQTQTPAPQPTFPTDITQDVQILTITGKDKSGKTVQMELILSRGSMMMMHPMMMSNPSWMFGMMGMMGGWGTMGPGMMGSGQMGPGMMGQQNQQYQPNPQLYQQMIDWMRSQYSVQGGSLTVGDKTYLIDFGSVRVVKDRLFMNVIVDSAKAGKAIIYGKLNADDGLKGTLLLWETRTTLEVAKIQGKGMIEDAFT